MTVLYEGRRAGGYLVSEGNNSISRGTVTVKSGQVLQAGTVIQLDGAAKAVAFTAVEETDGVLAVEAHGIIWDNVDASAGDVVGKTFTARMAEVNRQEIIVPNDDTAGSKLAAAVVSLAKLNIIAR